MSARSLFGRRDISTISRVSSIASSGALPEERASEILAEFRAVMPYEAAMLSYADLLSERRKPLALLGYPDELAAYLNSLRFHADLIERLDMIGTCSPVCTRLLPIDPKSLECTTEHLWPAGYVEGVAAALVASDGRYVGFLIASGDDTRHPTDSALAVVGQLAPTLANVVDQRQSLRWLASSLDEDCSAIGVSPDGTTTVLRGKPPREFLEPQAPIQAAVKREIARARETTGFIWPNEAGGGWLGIRAQRSWGGGLLVCIRDVEPHNLTKRELEVLTLLARGCSNPEIAKRLWVTTSTVKAHVERILEKLDVSNRTLAASHAAAEGLILPDSPHEGRVRHLGSVAG